MNSLKKKYIKKNQWLSAALDILSTEGITGINSITLARKLNISKSSFYWHFRNRDDLIKQMLQYWDDQYTKIVMQSPKLLGKKPNDRLFSIMLMIYENNLTEYDVHIRALAEHNLDAKKIIKKVYKERMNFLRAIFSEIGFKGEVLEMRTRQFVYYHSWENWMFSNDTKRKKLRLMKLQVELLTRK
jgi:AcrR family transcriptional regulator